MNTIKLLEENIGRTLFDVNRSNIFSEPPPRIMEIKPKVNKWDLIKLKSFVTTKETINKTKRQPTEWEKIFANNATDKGLVSKIYKHAAQYQEDKQPNQKMGRRPKEAFLQRRHTDDQEAHEKMLNIANF